MELENLTLCQNIDILTLSETWVNSSHTNASVALPGYCVFRADRKGKSGGGTCVYVHNRLHGRILNRHFELWIPTTVDTNTEVKA